MQRTAGTTLEEWRVADLLHRVDGPAATSAGRHKMWYQRGVMHRVEGYAVKMWYAPIGDEGGWYAHYWVLAGRWCDARSWARRARRLRWMLPAASSAFGGHEGDEGPNLRGGVGAV